MTCKSRPNEISARDLPVDPVDLDITALSCPMTFVRVRLLLDRLASGAVASVRLRGAEPHTNIPRQLGRLGHAVLSFVPEDPARPTPDAVWRLSFRKG
ncbi:MAG: sulfurtransferase TusA family protein [Acetobacteraceae bacterium]|nr:sulfurtransferase TusA family protein [Acetobacteraceae bacterium]